MKAQQLHFNTVQYEAVFDYKELQLMLIIIDYAIVDQCGLSTNSIRKLQDIYTGLLEVLLDE